MRMHVHVGICGVNDFVDETKLHVMFAIEGRFVENNAVVAGDVLFQPRGQGCLSHQMVDMQADDCSRVVVEGNFNAQVRQRRHMVELLEKSKQHATHALAVLLPT